MQYVDQNLAVYMRKTSSTTVGKVQVFQELRQPLLLDVWLIIEAIPEKLQLKIDSFARLEQLAPQDCILATNSSSFKSSEILDKVSQETKRRILSMQYYMPPKTMVVELMTDGFTDDDIIPILVARLKETGAFPYVARKESTGLIFNRLWAAVEQEVLTILSEGVSVPEEIDDIWQEIFLKGKIHPCRTMDGNLFLTNDPPSWQQADTLCNRGWPRYRRLHRQALHRGERIVFQTHSRLSQGELHRSRQIGQQVYRWRTICSWQAWPSCKESHLTCFRPWFGGTRAECNHRPSLATTLKRQRAKALGHGTGYA